MFHCEDPKCPLSSGFGTHKESGSAFAGKKDMKIGSVCSSIVYVHVYILYLYRYLYRYIYIFVCTYIYIYVYTGCGNKVTMLLNLKTNV